MRTLGATVDVAANGEIALVMMQKNTFDLVLMDCEMPVMDGFTCLLYTSDAADERSSVDLGGRRIIKTKNTVEDSVDGCTYKENK